MHQSCVIILTDHIEFVADHSQRKKSEMVVSSSLPLICSVVEMRKERGEVTLRKTDGDQPKTFTFDSVYDQQ